MFKKSTSKYLLLLILVLAAVLRLYGLGWNPPHLTSDEAALGYNAYSILRTARDEHGQFLPIIFESFGDWKPGLYVYLGIPFVAIFGLNEWSTRLPGAVSGVVAVYLVYLVVNQLFKNSKIALFSALFLAITPWHIHFSRGAWEAGLSLTLILAGIYFFLLALKKNYYLILSAALFALTLWTYQGAKLSTSIVILLLAGLHWKDLTKFSAKVLVGTIIASFLIALPIVLSFAGGKTGRLAVYSVFSYPRPEKYIQDILDQGGESKNSWQYGLYHSEKLNFLRGVLGRWTNHFSGRYLFFEGDWSNPRHGVPNAGVFLLADIIFVISGIVYFSRAGGKGRLFVLMWLLLAPLPAALSRDSVHGVRALNMVVPWVVVVAAGAAYLLDSLQTRWKKYILIAICVGYLFNFVYWLDQYWVHAPTQNSYYWQYGYKQIVSDVTGMQSKYPEIVIQQDYTQPYIFFLFFQKYDPTLYQKIWADSFIPSKSGDVGLVTKLDNITFRPIDWRADRGMKGKLFMADITRMPIEDSSDPKEFNLIDTIKLLNEKTAFRLVEVK